MVRFKKGTKVEVWSKLSGAWLSAKIISGNGHYYTVMYGDDTTERVPRKSMRLEPPRSQVLDSSRDNERIMMRERMSRLSAQASNGELTTKVIPKGAYISSEDKGKLDESDALLSKSPKKRRYILIGPDNQPVDAYPPREEDRESVGSSVGCCSMDMNGVSVVSFSPMATGNTSSDAESSTCDNRKFKKLKIVRRGSEAVDIHKLELDEYRCSIEKLRASGPTITWEQETWITDLRQRLNISNEEHQIHLKNLMSDGHSATYREQKQ